MNARMWWAVVIALVTVGIGAPRAAAANSSITVISGSGSGRVTSSPAGIDCTAFCSAAFEPGTVVTLTITPDGESSFILGNVCSGSGSAPTTCTFTMNGPKRLDLRFTSYRRLTVATTGSGSGRLKATLGPIDCGAVCTETMETGLSVDFHAGQYCLGYEASSPRPMRAAASSVSPGPAARPSRCPAARWP